MSSQFKKKKTGVVRDKGSSIISISKRLASNNTADFKTELDNIQHLNDNILGSLVGEPDPDRNVSDIIKRVEQSQKITGDRDSKLSLQQNPERRSLSPFSKTTSKQKTIKDEEVIRTVRTDSNMPQTQQMTSRDYDRVDIIVEIPKLPDIQIRKPEDLIAKRSYGDNREVALLVLALKKLAKTVSEENTKLKKQNMEYNIREEEYKSRTKVLTARVQELEAETRDSRERHTDHIKFDLQDLDARLKAMDDNLQKATGENSQERFLEDVVSRNKDYIARSQENAGAMKRLKENLSKLRSTLLLLNTRSA